MDEHTLRVLEFDKVKRLLARHVSSPLGRELVNALTPFQNLEMIREAQGETTEMRRLLDELKEPPLGGLRDVRPILEKARPAGHLLEPAELLEVKQLISVCHTLRQFFAALETPVPRLQRLASAVHSFERLETEVGKVVDEKGRVRDEASRDLHRIRKHLRMERADLVARLERFMRRPQIRGILQEEYVTVRDGRYVLPIQSNHKGKIKGIIHGRSDTGETVFIEPMATVEQGNRLRDLEVDEERELRRVLLRTTSLVRHELPELTVSLDVLGHLDFTLAKGRFSLAFRMSEPRIVSDGPLRIVRGRHPILLDQMGTAVVPLDLWLGNEFRAMVITGPNTGGKTVVLKAVGTLLLMAWSGMHIPAESETEIPLLSGLYGDIGDEQSIEQNLSTFSSHMTNIRDLLAKAGPGTLVLLDELGAGTDPVEGGALGRAVLRQLLEKRGLALVTTHLNDIKLYAYVTEGIENGAMEFDDETLEPTFRLHIGSTGQSNALRIAERLGLSPELLDQAKGFLDTDSDEAAVTLRQLEETLAASHRHERERQAELQRATRLRDDLLRRQSKLERERREILERARLEARSELEKLRKRIRETDSHLADVKRVAERCLQAFATAETEGDRARAAQDMGELKQMLDRAEAEREALDRELERSFVYQPPEREAIYTSEEIPPGSYVKIDGFSQPAEVLSVDKKKETVQVSVASMEMSLPVDRVTSVYTRAPDRAEEKPASRVSYQIREADVPYQLDLHGLTVDEAFPRLERYINDAAKTATDKVIIIHGSGRGILREMVRSYLEQNPAIESFAPGDFYEGGDNVTVAKLKRPR